MPTLIKNANEVITLKGNGQGPRTKEAMKEIGIIENGSVLVNQDRIVAIGTLEELQKEYPELIAEAEVIDATGKVVMPGLVDCHTHLVHGGTRENEFNMRLNGSTYMEIMNAGGGIHSTTRSTRQASFEELYEKTYNHLNEFLKYGITTVEAKSGYGLDWENEKKQLEVAKSFKKRMSLISSAHSWGRTLFPLNIKAVKTNLLRSSLTKCFQK